MGIRVIIYKNPFIIISFLVILFLPSDILGDVSNNRGTDISTTIVEDETRVFDPGGGSVMLPDPVEDEIFEHIPSIGISFADLSYRNKTTKN